MRTIICAECGRRFETPAHNRKFCPECSARRKSAQDREHMAQRRKAAAEIRENGFAVMVCKKCGREFRSECGRRTLCDECKRENKLRQNNERYREEVKRYRPEYKYCEVCGKKFKPAKFGQRFCNQGAYKNGLPEDGWLHHWGDRNPGVTEAAVEAKKAGESYGQYKARIWLEEQKRREKRSDKG